MPPSRDLTMLKPNPHKFLVAMARAELEPMELAQKAALSNNIVYSMRKGCYTKPKYIGAAAKAMGVDVEDLIERRLGSDT